MEKNCSNLFQELNFCQRKITLLFRDIWNEWLGYKAVIEAMKTKFANLLNEYNALQIENNKLKDCNGMSRGLIMECLDLIHKIDNSRQSSPETFGTTLGILKQNLTDAIHIEKNFILFSHSYLMKKKPYNFKKETHCQKANSVQVKNESMIPEERNDLKKVFFSNVNNKESFPSSNTLSPPKKKSNEMNKMEDDLEPVENKPKRREKKISDILKEHNSTFLEKKSDRKIRSGSKDITVLKNGDMQEMTQSRLNINIFKIKKLNDDLTVESNSSRSFSQFGVDTEEDDFILESPKLVPYLEDLVSNKKGINQIQIQNPNQMRKTGEVENLVDLDETFVPSIIVKKFKLSDEEKDKANNFTPFTLEEIQCPKSPEFDSVPFMYNKKSKINEKCEKLKAPTPQCSDSNKCFKVKNVKKVDIGENEKKIFNNFSGHRHKELEVEIEDTPPGYWKPYLTSSVMSHEDSVDN